MQQLEQGKEAPQLLMGLLRHLRNLVVIASTQKAPSHDALLASLVDEPTERLTQLQEQATRCSLQELVVLLQVATGAYELVRRSPMAQTILELIVIKLATRGQWQSIDEISRRLERLATESRSASGTLPASPQPDSQSQRTSPIEATTPTPQPSHAPASAPVSMQGTGSEELLALWPKFLEQLGAQKMSLAAYLADAKPLQLQQGTMTVGLPAFALHQEVLGLTENRRLITKLLSQLCGTTVSVDYMTLPEQPEPSRHPPASEESATAPPIVQDIVKLFDATLLNRPGTAAS
jgi:DNA polymerase III gamma/tau subunit